MAVSIKKRDPIIEVMVIVVNRGKGERVVKLLNSLQVDLQVMSLGRGTADSSMAEYFNLDLSEKEVIFALIKMRHEEKILNAINERLKFNEKNTGLAFTIPIKSAMFSLLDKMGFEF